MTVSCTKVGLAYAACASVRFVNRHDEKDDPLFLQQTSLNCAPNPAEGRFEWEEGVDSPLDFAWHSSLHLAYQTNVCRNLAVASDMVLEVDSRIILESGDLVLESAQRLVGSLRAGLELIFGEHSIEIKLVSMGVPYLFAQSRLTESASLSIIPNEAIILIVS